MFNGTDEYRAEVERAQAAGVRVESVRLSMWSHEDAVVVRGRLRTRRGGVLDDTRMFWLHRVHDGKVVWTSSSPDLAGCWRRRDTDRRLASEAVHRAPPRGGVSLTDDIRAGAARVAAEAQSVRINEDAIEEYASTLPAESPPAPDLEGADDETRAAFSLQLNAINFGSGWFPTLRKPPGLSGFRTVEAGLRAQRAVDERRAADDHATRRSPRRSARTPSTS